MLILCDEFSSHLLLSKKHSTENQTWYNSLWDMKDCFNFFLWTLYGLFSRIPGQKSCVMRQAVGNFLKRRKFRKPGFEIVYHGIGGVCEIRLLLLGHQITTGLFSKMN